MLYHKIICCVLKEKAAHRNESLNDDAFEINNFILNFLILIICLILIDGYKFGYIFSIAKRNLRFLIVIVIDCAEKNFLVYEI